MFLTLRHQDGTASTVAVNNASTIHVQTWRPPNFAQEGDSPPILVEDQTFSLAGVVAVTLDDGQPADAELATVTATLEPLTDAEAAALDAQFVSAPAPWEDD